MAEATKNPRSHPPRSGPAAPRHHHRRRGRRRQRPCLPHRHHRPHRPALDLLADIVQHPAFTPTTSNAAQASPHRHRPAGRFPQAIGNNVGPTLLFGQTPYGQPPIGTIASITALTPPTSPASTPPTSAPPIPPSPSPAISRKPRPARSPRSTLAAGPPPLRRSHHPRSAHPAHPQNRHH